MTLYPAFCENMGAGLLPEELRAPRPATWRELSHEILNPRHRVLGRFQARLKISGYINIAWNYTLQPDDLAYLLTAFGRGEYVVTGLVDETAKLLRVEQHGVAMLSPFVIDGTVHWGRPVVIFYPPQQPH